ncbi:hypothetical protein HHI36_019533, partial [Cryptolaemus montrouzieri]
ECTKPVICQENHPGPSGLAFMYPNRPTEQIKGSLVKTLRKRHVKKCLISLKAQEFMP